MELIPLQSSWIHGAHYDADSQVLTVKVGDTMYERAGVPPEVAQGLFAAPSPGTYYNQALGGKQYPTAKVK